MGAKLDLDLWRDVSGDARLLQQAAASDPRAAKDIAALRRGWSQEQVHCALELVEARRRGANKFERVASLVADREGMEQATSESVARHKARRFGELEPQEILDLCCGIGGDAMSLGRVASVLAVDHDPVRAWMTEVNGVVASARVRSQVADVTEIDVDGRFVHIDPSRRADGRRRWNFEDYEPGPEFLRELFMRSGGAAIKLGPGVDPAVLPDGELEFISERGHLVQAVLWTGELARSSRTATRVPAGTTLSGTATDVGRTSAGNFRRYLCVPDPALERAGLVGAHPQVATLEEPAPGLGLFTTDTEPDDWFTSFEVQEVMPWRSKNVARWLRDHDAGTVEVKTRGGAVEPEKTRRELSGSGSVPFTVFVLRLGKAKKAVITVR